MRSAYIQPSLLLTYPLLLPQIDGSTLRTLCLQHGPLITFHLNLTQGNAVVRYSSKEEAAKAQKSLHMYVFLRPLILPSSHKCPTVLEGQECCGTPPCTPGSPLSSRTVPGGWRSKAKCGRPDF